MNEFRLACGLSVPAAMTHGRAVQLMVGVTLMWSPGDEAPSSAVLGGGLPVLGALAVNEALALRR